MYENLNAVVDDSETPIESFPISIAKMIRTDDILDFEQKRQSLARTCQKIHFSQ